MANFVVNIGNYIDDDGYYTKIINTKPPMKSAGAIFAKEYIVGTDFTSGDDIIINISACSKIRFACFVSNVGAIKAFAETALTGGGRTLTLSSVTTNIKAHIIHDA